MKSHLRSAVYTLAIFLFISTSASATIIEFQFTGRLTMLDQSGYVFADPANTDIDPYGLQTSINSTMTFDTASSNASVGVVIAPFSIFGSPNTTMRNINTQRIDGTNYLLVNMVVDWGTEIGIPTSMVWDATGLYNAIDFGLQPGDVISGDVLKDSSGNILVSSLGSATPATELSASSDINGNIVSYQGPAPLAMTGFDTNPLCFTASPGDKSCYGVNPSSDGILFDDGIGGSPLIDGPVPGFNVNLDIGSGNSMKVLSVSSVPVPAAIWLFASGFLGLLGVARRK